MMKHTPGPWKVQRRDPRCAPDPTILGPGPGSSDAPTYVAVVKANETKHIMSTHGGWVVPKVDEAEANAHLIAAAPELLDACKALEHAESVWANCEECDGASRFPELCENCFPLFDDARLKRRAAIAKAEGE